MKEGRGSARIARYEEQEQELASRGDISELERTYNSVGRTRKPMMVRGDSLP